MAEAIKKAEVIFGDKIPDLLLIKNSTQKGHINFVKLSAVDYDKNYEMVYGSNLEEVFEELDERIAKLQAIRQDLDVVNKE